MVRVVGIAIAIFALLAILFSSPAAAQGDWEKEAREIAKSLNCPVCVGYTLYECPLEVCEQWRGLILQKLSQGETREEIIQYFIDQYGEQVLNFPRPEGFNWLAWILPFLALGGGGIWLARVLRSFIARRQAAAVSAADKVPAEYLQKVEEELQEWE